MSKTVGNVYDPVPVLDQYGADPLRYYLLSKLSPYNDGDFSEEKLFAAYNSDLANSLGNTVQRVATMAERSGFSFAQDTPPGFRSQVKERMDEYRFDRALEEIWKSIAMIEKKIDETQPWKLEGQQLQVTLMELIAHLRQVGYELQPFLPETGERILEIFKGPKIGAPKPLFPRLA
jgi:methionyl-tRNA synthetase